MKNVIWPDTVTKYLVLRRCIEITQHNFRKGGFDTQYKELCSALCQVTC